MWFGRVIYYYAQLACVFCAVMGVMYLLCVVAVTGIYYNPPVTTLDELTYQKASSPKVLLGIREQNKHIFQYIDEISFQERKEYYYNIIRQDFPIEMRVVIIRCSIVSALLALVCFTHWQLMRSNRMFVDHDSA